MAMVDLAIYGADHPLPLSEISERQEISLSYLEQLFVLLRRNFLVHSVRGPGGGYMLARNSTSIRISDIVIAVDESLSAIRCKPGSAKGCQSDGQQCLTHDLWEELGNQISLYLNSVSLADVADRRVSGTSSLIFDRVPTSSSESINISDI